MHPDRFATQSGVLLRYAFPEEPSFFLSTTAEIAQDDRNFPLCDRRLVAIANNGERLIGMASIGKYNHPSLGEVAYLYRGVVTPNYQRQGVGRALIDLRLSSLSMLGMDAITPDIVYVDTYHPEYADHISSALVNHSFKVRDCPEFKILYHPQQILVAEIVKQINSGVFIKFGLDIRVPDIAKPKESHSVSAKDLVANGAGELPQMIETNYNYLAFFRSKIKAAAFLAVLKFGYEFKENKSTFMNFITKIVQKFPAHDTLIDGSNYHTLQETNNINVGKLHNRPRFRRAGVKI
jgi:GNAT superfamily N-acetyltransferase